MARGFRVGDWLVQPSLNLVSRAESSITIEPKVMDVLVCLVQHSGEVIPKNSIISEVWDNGFVTDEVLTNAISALRKAFGDDARNPRYIQTIARRGYRLIAPVEEENPSSRFEILRKLGRGAMGEVFLALDHVLHRKVALKFLPEQLEHDTAAKNQLLHEARAAAALDHPFICKTYDIGKLEGRTFIAMEYVEGETLKERLARGRPSVQECVRLAEEITEALETASEKGIVHSDVKPSNIMLTKQNHVKVTDFGVARRIPMAGNEDEDWTATLTDDDTTGGTLPYMSPEQLLKKAVDSRADIFSLGIVLYETLSGVNPFRREVAIETANAILNHAPEDLIDHSEEIPDALSQIVARMLSKEPADRYQTIHQIRIDLAEFSGAKAQAVSTHRTPRPKARQWVAGTALLILTVLAVKFFPFIPMAEVDAPIESIAVLPLVNRSGDPDQEYLGEGIAGSISSSLVRLAGLRVIPASSLRRYRGQQVDVRKAASELGVRAVLTGTLVVRNETLYLNLELMDAQENKLLWGAPYKQKLAGIFRIEEEATTEIAQALRLNLTAVQHQRLARRETQSHAAYEAYLRGLFQTQNAKSKRDEMKAQEYFQFAISEDPDFALAYVGLANSYWSAAFSGSEFEFYPKARAMAEKALEIDATLPEAHDLMARILAFYDRDWEGAEREFKKAASLNGDVPILSDHRVFYLFWLGRDEEAMIELERFQESYDPLSSELQYVLGWKHFIIGDYEQAVQQFSRALELDPGYLDCHIMLGESYLGMGLHEEAYDSFMEGAVSINPMKAELFKSEYESSGIEGFLRAFLDHWKWRPYDIAAVSALLGDKDQAFNWLEKTYEQPVHWPFIVDPRFDSLKDDSRYVAQLRQLNLEP